MAVVNRTSEDRDSEKTRTRNAGTMQEEPEQHHHQRDGPEGVHVRRGEPGQRARGGHAEHRQHRAEGDPRHQRGAGDLQRDLGTPPQERQRGADRAPVEFGHGQCPCRKPGTRAFRSTRCMIVTRTRLIPTYRTVTVTKDSYGWAVYSVSCCAWAASSRQVDRRGHRRVLEDVEQLGGERGDDDAEGHRHQDGPVGLGQREPEGQRRRALPARQRLDPGPHLLADAGPGEEPQAEPGRHERLRERGQRLHAGRRGLPGGAPGRR